MDELLPCPFCGGEAEARKGAVLNAIVCQCSSHVFYSCEFSKNATAEAWNTRIHDSGWEAAARYWQRMYEEVVQDINPEVNND